MTKQVFLTGGAGFIGCDLVRELLQACYDVVNLDNLTYAGSRASLADVEGRIGYTFVQGDIGDK